MVEVARVEVAMVEAAMIKVAIVEQPDHWRIFWAQERNPYRATGRLLFRPIIWKYRLRTCSSQQET